MHPTSSCTTYILYCVLCLSMIMWYHHQLWFPTYLTHFTHDITITYIVQSLTAPLAAFTMALLLGSYCISSIRAARREARYNPPDTTAKTAKTATAAADAAAATAATAVGSGSDSWVARALEEERREKEEKEKEKRGRWWWSWSWGYSYYTLTEMGERWWSGFFIFFFWLSSYWVVFYVCTVQCLTESDDQSI